MYKMTLALCAALLVSTAAFATHAPLEIGRIVTQQKQIRADVLAGKGRYRDMPTSKREELLSKQDQLLRMLDGKQTTDELTDEQRMQAFNALEWIESTINNEQDEALVCTRERTIGSNRVTRVCRTKAQMEEARERAREQMMHGGACTDLGGVGCTGG